MAVAQVALGERLVHASGERFGVVGAGPYALALLGHDDRRAGVLAHRQDAAGGNAGVLEQVVDDELVVRRRLGIIEVELYLINSAQLEIEGFYAFDDDEIEDAIEDLETSLAGAKLVTDLLQAVTEPVPSILSTLGVPSFDTSTSAPQDAAMKALKELKEKFTDKRKIGTWRLHIPRQQFRFLCRVTEECINGYWVATGREFVGERIGPPTFVKSAPFEIQNLRETDRAWYTMSRPFMDKNAAAEKQIEAAANRCAG